MRKIDVLIAENASGAGHPVKVVADALVADVMPALVAELRLPQTDLFGQELVYTLRQAGIALPQNRTLRAAGVASGARLTLDSSTLNDPEFYSSTTIADASLFAPVSSTVVTPAANAPTFKKERKWARRALLLGGGTLLGALGISLGYAYSTYVTTLFTTQPSLPTQPIANAQQPPNGLPTTAKLQFTFTRHQQLVRSVSWSPTGALLASGADNGQLFIWSPEGLLQHTFTHAQSVRSVAWSSDGKRIAGASGNQVIFYDALNGVQIAQSGRHHRQTVNSVAWSIHGHMYVVSGAADRQAIVWDSVTYRPLTAFDLHTTSIEVVALAADGQSVATASQGGAIRVWNASNGVELHGYYSDGNVPVHALTWSPMAAQLAAGGDDGAVRVWNSGRLCQQQQGQDNKAVCMDIPQRLSVARVPVRALSWSPDSHFLASGADDGLLCVWNLAQPQKPLFSIRAGAPVQSIVWSPDSQKLALASGKSVTIWALS